MSEFAVFYFMFFGVLTNILMFAWLVGFIAEHFGISK